MRKFIIILTIIGILGSPGSAVAQGATDGVVEGQVINETEDGGSVAGVTVTLFGVADDTVEEMATTETDAQGRFQFTQISAGHRYLILVHYMGVDYYYPIVLGDDETSKYIEVFVCNTTTNDEAIRVTLAHVIIYVEEGTLLVAEVLQLVNDSDRTYVGAEGIDNVEREGVLVFSLPQGATDFEAPAELMPDYLSLDNNRITYAVPFPPGERQLIYSYKLAKPGAGEFVFHLDASYPIDSLDVMVEGEDIEVASTKLAPAEPVSTATGEVFVHLQGKNLARGNRIDVGISVVSQSAGLAFSILGIVVAVIIIIGIIGYMAKKRKATS